MSPAAPAHDPPPIPAGVMHRYGSPLTLARPLGTRPPPPPPNPWLAFPPALLAGGWGASAVLAVAVSAGAAAPAAWIEAAAAIFGLTPLLFVTGLWAGARAPSRGPTRPSQPTVRAASRVSVPRVSRSSSTSPGARLPIPAPRPPTVPMLAGSRIAPAAAALGAGALAELPRRVTAAVRPPQFQMLVRMLDDIDRIEREALGEERAISTPLAATSARGEGCVECALSLPWSEAALTRCRTCESPLCPECATDAAHEGHAGSCAPCWTLEQGFVGLGMPVVPGAAPLPIAPVSASDRSVLSDPAEPPFEWESLGRSELGSALPPASRPVSGPVIG